MEIKFIGNFTQIVGKRSISITLQNIVCIEEVIEYLSEKYPKIKQEYFNDDDWENTALIFIDGKIAKSNDRVDNSSLIVFSTPIDGG